MSGDASGSDDRQQWQEIGPEVPRRGGAFVRWLGRSYLRVRGWRVEGLWPDEAKLIVAVAPHTSNHDFVLTVAVNFAYNLRSSFLIKKSLFRFPLAWPLRRFGGIPVDRAATHGLVGELVQVFAAREKLILGIAPEGTRGHVRQWKTGFAQVAAAAGVPILPVTLNYDTRLIRFEPVIDQLDDPTATVAAVKALADQAWPELLEREAAR